VLCFAIEQLDPPAASMASTDGSMKTVINEWLDDEGEVILRDECYSAETVQAMRDETLQRNAWCLYPQLPKFVDL